MSEEKDLKKPKKRGRPFANKEISIDEVLDEAIKVFAEKGYYGAQLKEIAERAGIANSMISYHFKNKEELWKKAVMRLTQKMLKKLDEVRSYFKDLEGVSAMKAYNRQLVYFAARYPEFFKIIFLEMGQKTPRSEWMIEHVLKPFHIYGEESFFYQQRKDTSYPYAHIVGIVYGAASIFFNISYQMQEQFGVDPFTDENIERHADVVNKLLFRGLES